MAKKRSTTAKSTKSRARANTAATGAKRRTKATRKATSKPAATRAKPGPQKRGGETKPKRVGLLDAAAQILAKAKEPMGCKAIVEQVIAQKLWTTRGKTPHATLYSGIIREIAKKGKDARFKKTGRGTFALKR